MIIGSIVPDAVYATGVNRDFFRLQIGDFAFPLFQGVGDQPIYKAELANVGVDGDTMDKWQHSVIPSDLQSINLWRMKFTVVSVMVNRFPLSL